MTTIPYGTQLSFWEDLPSEHDIVFDVTSCIPGCPFNRVYEAKDKGTTVFAQRFGRVLVDPEKFLITVQKDFPTSQSEKVYHYIADDQWEAFAKIQELTGRNPLWKMTLADEQLPSNLGGH